MNIGLLFTCYNRYEKTLSCIKSIKRAGAYANSRGLELKLYWYITDAGSSDATVEAIRGEIDPNSLQLRIASNDTYYSNGMRISMEEAAQSSDLDYILLVNDDVTFYEDFLYKLLTSLTATSEIKIDLHENNQTPNDNALNNDTVIIGALDDGKGNQTYGGVRYNALPIDYTGHKMLFHKIAYSRVSITEDNKSCHTFNANCVLIPIGIFKEVGLMDASYVHSLGDFDYGMMIWERGYSLRSSDFYVGCCLNNSKKGSWMDTSLDRLSRIKALNSVKGSPTRLWFYYLNKHFSLLTAIIYSISPYVRIILGR